MVDRISNVLSLRFQVQRTSESPRVGLQRMRFRAFVLFTVFVVYKISEFGIIVFEIQLLEIGLV